MREAVTFIPSFGAYVKGVKRVEDFSDKKIILLVGKNKLTLNGESLEISSYIRGDMFVRGKVWGITYD